MWTPPRTVNNPAHMGYKCPVSDVILVSLCYIDSKIHSGIIIYNYLVSLNKIILSKKDI